MQKSAAFTLIELLITLVIVSIMLTMSLPLYKNMMLKSKDELLILNMSNTIQFARQEAMIRHAAIGLCGSQTSVACDGAWDRGILVFTDNYQDGSIHESTQILLATREKAAHGEMRNRSYPYYRYYLLFNYEHQTSQDNSTFWHCHEGGQAPTFALIINNAGRLSVKRPNSQGKIVDSSGNMINC